MSEVKINDRVLVVIIFMYCLQEDVSQSRIAKILGRDIPTIGREIRRIRGQRGYRPRQADKKAQDRRYPPHVTRFHSAEAGHRSQPPLPFFGGKKEIIMAHGRGRPQKFCKKELHELAEKFREYIESETVPIVLEFAARNGLCRHDVYDHDEFFTLIRMCVTKKEAALESGALRGELNSTMAIFSLKQLGWRDKQEIEHIGDQVIYRSEKPDKPGNAGVS